MKKKKGLLKVESLVKKLRAENRQLQSAYLKPEKKGLKLPKRNHQVKNLPPKRNHNQDMKFPKAYLKNTDTINVIIETPYKSRNKFDYDKETGLFKFCKVIPT